MQASLAFGSPASRALARASSAPREALPRGGPRAKGDRQRQRDLASSGQWAVLRLQPSSTKVRERFNGIGRVDRPRRGVARDRRGRRSGDRPGKPFSSKSSSSSSTSRRSELATSSGTMMVSTSRVADGSKASAGEPAGNVRAEPMKCLPASSSLDRIHGSRKSRNMPPSRRPPSVVTSVPPRASCRPHTVRS